MLPRNVLIFGASGLIGRFLTDDLRSRGFQVTAVARKFVPAQKTSPLDLERPIMTMDAVALTQMLCERTIDVVVNCLGVLQDGPGSDTAAVHRDFVQRLLCAIKASGRAIRLIHISIPGVEKDDLTAFSITKREADAMIATSGVRYAILRPGFVIAPAAFGGSAMVRAFAATPLALPTAESARALQPVAVEDIAATASWLAARDVDEAAANSVTWDLMQKQPVTLGDVIGAFRRSFGTREWPRIRVPASLLTISVKLADLVGWLGWQSPLRSTAMAELGRGVSGDPSAWMSATGIVPIELNLAVPRGATIQEKWFARLYLIKAMVIASLVVFWGVSGFIALFVSYDAAAGILNSHHFPLSLIAPITVLTGLMDMMIGVLISFRRTCVFGLGWGILASLGYMLGAAILTPDLWIEPLGALVKTGPAIVLMLVALATLDSR
ncbi:SDR family oxidoreductase [Bradyrhizobium sp.]|uniref:SDR family oxidoreductase n=1 Tax=Bradyrhizobium sp. TaxID=376 RepID=UPI00261ED21D|nr:SDR family oxidoreductase [Bradyrhizobium sp.]